MGGKGDNSLNAYFLHEQNATPTCTSFHSINSHRGTVHILHQYCTRTCIEQLHRNNGHNATLYDIGCIIGGQLSVDCILHGNRLLNCTIIAVYRNPHDVIAAVLPLHKRQHKHTKQKYRLIALFPRMRFAYCDSLAFYRITHIHLSNSFVS